MQTELIECPGCHKDIKYGLEASDMIDMDSVDGDEAEDDCFKCPECGSRLRVTVRMTVVFDVKDVELIEEGRP